jgi:hypothetical protein
MNDPHLYICESCFNVQKRRRKRKCEVCKSETFHCDEWILPTIVLLNKKGYKTKYCCAGHITLQDKEKSDLNRRFGTYVFFEEKSPKPLPKGFVHSPGPNYEYVIYWGGSQGIEWSDYPTLGERMIALAKALGVLYKWAEDLPNRNAQASAENCLVES